MSDSDSDDTVCQVTGRRGIYPSESDSRVAFLDSDDCSGSYCCSLCCCYFCFRFKLGWL